MIKSKHIYIIYISIAILYSIACYIRVFTGGGADDWGYLSMIGPIILIPFYFAATIIGTLIFWKNNEVKIALWVSMGLIILISGFYCVSEFILFAMNWNKA